jgi:hypothetical protein
MIRPMHPVNHKFQNENGQNNSKNNGSIEGDKI